MRSTPTVLILLPLVAAPLFGAEAEAAPSDAMRAVAWLAGEWEGEGWIMTGPGQRTEFRGTESVESRLGGGVLIIEGRHTAADDPNVVVHHALAVVSWDSGSGEYRFEPHVAGRPKPQTAARVEDGVFIWTMEVPGGRVRYRIRQSESGEWLETGERSAGPGKWFPFFEMTMRRVR